jgi:hypothetical protein
VVTARGQTPDPIPNSAVKTLSADGTASQGAEEQVAARLSRPRAITTVPAGTVALCCARGRPGRPLRDRRFKTTLARGGAAR